MSYDLYVDQPRGDASVQSRLLVNKGDGSIGGYLELVHGTRAANKQLERAAYNEYIAAELSLMRTLKLEQPSALDFQPLPLGAWFLQFTFRLTKPWMSKDDDPLYVAESVNPVRKDKVFRVPVMSAASWKGLLRWTVMRVGLVELKDMPHEFAGERLRQTLLFGDEKGEEAGAHKDFAAYLDVLGHEGARKLYEQKVRERFGLGDSAEMLHHAGRLMCYPTFFDLIDVEVINPHSRKTKAGSHPIYLECVPAGASGTFSLLYVPVDLIGRSSDDQIRAEAKADLARVAEAVGAMMLTYGFSAKRTSGYGAARDEITGTVRTHAGKRNFERITFARLAAEAQNVGF